MVGSNDNESSMEMSEEGNPKRIRVKEIDRISALPDALLLEILHRLPSTEHAIRTGTLSKRWKHIWTSISTLIFENVNDEHRLSDFIWFVCKTLTQCRQPKLKKFAVHTIYEIQFESQVNSWLRYTLSCNVEELDFTLYYCDKGSMDYKAVFLLNDDVFINSALTDLTLQGCIFDPTRVICWKRLKSLQIVNGNLGADLIENILAGSPLMETLVSHEDYGSWQMVITSKNIKKLMFSEYVEYYPDGESELQINNVVRYAIRCNAEELDLDFHKEDHKAEGLFDKN